VLSYDLDDERLLILTSDRGRAPEPAYTAEAVVADATLDLAVLRVTGDAYGDPLRRELDLPYVPLGDSDAVQLADPVSLFGYPSIGGGSLTYTAGVVSGFLYEDELDDPAWITTDAVMAGGSSGGTAVDRQGRLIGVPTQGTSLDCRPGDTNGDGEIDAEDVGCVPIGGSIGQLRPINLALPLLRQADPTLGSDVTDQE
jgi:S1-C subfamily serine protease